MNAKLMNLSLIVLMQSSGMTSLCIAFWNFVKKHSYLMIDAFVYNCKKCLNHNIEQLIWSAVFDKI